MSQRVVSKRTKRLFIGFGAVGIACICILTAAEMIVGNVRVPAKSNAIVQPATPAHATK
jgi:hypothetical protein